MYLLSTYFRSTALYAVVQEVPSSEGIYNCLFHLWNNCNLWNRSRMCTGMRVIQVIGVTSIYHFDSVCCAHFIMKWQSSFHWVVLLASACIMTSILSNMSFKKVIMWCKVMACLLDIHMVQCWNSRRPSMTCFTIAHSYCIVLSGQRLLNWDFLSHSLVNSPNQ
jgi:hypothetical protein